MIRFRGVGQESQVVHVSNFAVSHAGIHRDDGQQDLILDTIYTVFVPTNAAFAKLEKEILFKIGKKDNLPYFGNW